LDFRYSTQDLNLQPGPGARVAARILPSRAAECRLPALLHNPGQVGLPAGVESASVPDQFIPTVLTAMGIEADEVDLAVMAATHDLYWPALLELLSLDTSDVEPELCPDLSRAP